MKRKWVALTEAECRIIIYALNELRTSMIAQGRYTDVVDETMQKIIKTPLKKVKAA